MLILLLKENNRIYEVWKETGGNPKSWRKVIVDGYDQNALSVCTNVSKNKFIIWKSDTRRILSPGSIVIHLNYHNFSKMCHSYFCYSKWYASKKQKVMKKYSIVLCCRTTAFSEMAGVWKKQMSKEKFSLIDMPSLCHLNIKVCWSRSLLQIPELYFSFY